MTQDVEGVVISVRDRIPPPEPGIGIYDDGLRISQHYPWFTRISEWFIWSQIKKMFPTVAMTSEALADQKEGLLFRFTDHERRTQADYGRLFVEIKRHAQQTAIGTGLTLALAGNAAVVPEDVHNDLCACVGALEGLASYWLYSGTATPEQEAFARRLYEGTYNLNRALNPPTDPA